MSGPELRTKLGGIRAMTDAPTHYCAGCEHGTLTRLVASAIDTLGLRERTVMVDSVGCSVLAFRYFNVDHVVAPHGRAPAVAAGIKRSRPDLVVYSIQGDGDAAAIGLLELVYAAQRGTPITIFLVNNGIYGMTGGQMAPTTLTGAVTTTTPYGRDSKLTGAELDVSKLIGQIEGASYVKRASLVLTEIESPHGSVYTIKNILDAKRAVENAFRVQELGGFAFVELLSTCSVNWKMSVVESKRYVRDYTIKRFPLGVYRDVFGVEKR